MKLHYVKTSNHQLFMAAVAKVQNGAAREAQIILLAGGILVQEKAAVSTIMTQPVTLFI